MPNVFLAPGLAAHIRRSIEEGVSLEEINPNEQNLIRLIGKIRPPIRMWAVKQSIKNKWKTVKEGDIILFYSRGKFIFRGDVAFTYPLKESEEQLNEARRIAEIVWGRDARDGETWPYLIFLSKTEEVDIPLDQLNRATGYHEKYVVNGFTRVRNPEGVLSLLEEKYRISEKKSRAEVMEDEHDKIAQYIYEIGEMIGYQPEKKWRVDRSEYDVVWHRPPREGPRCVFEVQVRGSVESALLKLKDAWDRWGSTVFLISSPEQIEDVKKKHLRGSLHELVEENAIALVTFQEIEEFHRFKMKYEWLERKFGLKPR
jgi:predicted RNA-binding protein